MELPGTGSDFRPADCRLPGLLLAQDGSLVRRRRGGLRPGPQPVPWVDVLELSRHIKVSVGGEVVAETGPRRLCSSRPGCRRATTCLQKTCAGEALLRARKLASARTRVWRPTTGRLRPGARRVEDLVWYYPEPIPEAAKLKGHLTFFNEKVDLEVDGEVQERPRTQWS